MGVRGISSFRSREGGLPSGRALPRSRALVFDRFSTNERVSRLARFNFHVSPKVAVLLCTYQGEEFLGEQLNSIKAQSYKNWILYASDDCSNDSTFSLLDSFAKSIPGKVQVSRMDENVGFQANFLSLISNPEIVADVYAFSDQDDVWEKDKITRAVEWLMTVPRDVPALYCARTTLVDESGKVIGCSPLFGKKPDFKNALVQSIGGGNTMLLNHAARQLIASCGVQSEIACHDWWSYILVSGCGGVVKYDPVPSVKYRQHGGNHIGANTSWYARIERIRLLLKGQFKAWNDVHLFELHKVQHLLTPENQLILQNFIKARDGGFMGRLRSFQKSRVYRQTLLGNLGLFAAVILKKI